MNYRPVPRAVIPLIAAAMAIFLLTVTIGILNGTDLVNFSHGALLAHVHAGTLGWITLSVFAASAWVLGADKMPSILRNGAILAVVLYVIAFWTNALKLRPVAGTFMLIIIFWFAVWAFQTRSRSGRPLTVVSLGVLLALINLCVGGILGVVLGLVLGGIIHGIPSGIAGAHPAMMVAGYLILAGASLNEHLMQGPGWDRMTKPGAAQDIMLFLAGIILAIALLGNIQPLLGLNLLFEVLGIGFAVVRNWRAITGAGWGSASPARNGAMSILFLIPGLALLAYLIGRYAQDIESAPRGLFIALDHATFVGVLTNAIFGVLLVAAATRRNIWEWADQIVFWGMNLGLIVFLIGLVTDTVLMKRLGTPVMGTCILLGLLTAAVRLSGGGKATDASDSGVPASPPPAPAG